MKKQIRFFMIILLSAGPISAFSQAGIYMYSTALPGAITTGVHTGETAIISLTRSYQDSGTINGTSGGAGATHATNDGITILKQYDKTSIPLKGFLWTGSQLMSGSSNAKLEIRFYNASDVMYYKITYALVFVSDFTESGEICPSGCAGINEQIKFRFSAVEERDMLTGVYKCWSFVNNSAICP